MSHRILRGIGVCAGRVHGHVLALATGPVPEPDTRTCADHDGEVARLSAAVERVVVELERRAEQASGDAAEVLGMTAMMAGDPSLLKDATERIRTADRTAERAVWESANGFAEMLKTRGGYFAERAADVHDVRDRVVTDLADMSLPSTPRLSDPAVLTAHDLAPADTASLDASKVLALVTEEGGPTSHTAIVARSLGIPAVVACAGITKVPTGESVLVDGESGQVRLGAVVADNSDDGSGDTMMQLTGTLADGVSLAANVGEPSGATVAREIGARDVGLLRTEFLFDDRQTAPADHEQARAYADVLALFPGGRVVIRTLDVGADKQLAFVSDDPGPNPALGMRGLRVSRAAPKLLDVQLAAIARAAGRHDGQVCTMAPMVATPEEARWFAARARKQGLTAGVMIEVPAAAVHAERILAEVDFVSVGTNDLGQYTFAADRQSAAVAALNDPWQPALLALLASVGDAGARTGKPVGVCGEAAADPLLAPVLIGLGMTSLSMTPRALPTVAARLSTILDLTDCQRAARAALHADSPDAARTAAREALAR